MHCTGTVRSTLIKNFQSPTFQQRNYCGLDRSNTFTPYCEWISSWNDLASRVPRIPTPEEGLCSSSGFPTFAASMQEQAPKAWVGPCHTQVIPTAGQLVPSFVGVGATDWLPNPSESLSQSAVLFCPVHSCCCACFMDQIC